MVAIVTGATGDIGAAIALALARRGDDVAVHYHRHAERAAELARAIRDAGARATEVAADVTDLAAVEAAVDQVAATLGEPAILVNAAAAVRFERFLDSDPSRWDEQIAVTLRGTLNCCRPVARRMARAGYGRIVNLAAEGALVGEPGLAVASAAKAGVLGFTRSLARELAPAGITVNAVSPGFVPTDSVPPRLRTPERTAEIAKRYPAGRLGTPEDIAATVAFLASEEAGYVTGQTVSVSGGYSVR
jgi:NAD(P)-dependent dehydrogenase (short-subunit alcohol dehydrogenase family)